MENKVLSLYGIAPIRHTIDPIYGDHDWIDVNAYAGSFEYAKLEANKVDAYIPQWAKANPVVRYSQVIIIEVVPGMTLDVRIPGKPGTERITIE